MSQLDKYIQDVGRHVVAPGPIKDRFLADLREQGREMESTGLTEEEVVNRLGPPREVAAEFMQSRPLVYANIFERFVAFMLDAALSTMLVFPGVFLVFVVPLWLNNPDLFVRLDHQPLAFQPWDINLLELGLMIIGGLAATGIALLYFPVMEHLFGWTLGKKALGMKVVTEEGAPVGLGAAVLRRLSYYFDILFLDAIFIPFTEKRQRAFDKVAKTVVVRDGDRLWLALLLFVIAATFFTLLGILTIVVFSAMEGPVFDLL